MTQERFGQRNQRVCTTALMTGLCILAAFTLPALHSPALGQPTAPKSHDAQGQFSEKSIEQRIGRLRGMSDAERAHATRQLALDIRQVSPIETRQGLAEELANLSTEGDFGQATLQAVADTLSGALRTRPVPGTDEVSGAPYEELALLVRYEHVYVSLDSPRFAAAMAQLQTEDARRQKASFTLKDLQGKSWTLTALRGKVVLVNFWATWCPPCRKEIPDLETLSARFKSQGLIVLGISSDDSAKVRAFAAEHGMTYPILLDPGGKVSKRFAVEGIPHTFFYDRSGHLAAQAIDMRTQKQFLALLSHVGLQ